jgi:hypothetical protein
MRHYPNTTASLLSAVTKTENFSLRFFRFFLPPHFLKVKGKEIFCFAICSQARRFGVHYEKRVVVLVRNPQFSANDGVLQRHPQHSPRAISARATSA